ncbi:MAG: tyrosine recombinase [Elusimicrobiota bacterium]
MKPDDMLDGFLRHLRVERGLSENTCLSYGYQLGAYVAFLRDRGKEPATAMRDDVLAYLERRKAAGLKSASLFIAAMAVRQFHRHLVGSSRAPADPTGGMRLPRFKQRIPKPVDAEGMDRLLRPPVGAKFSALRDHAMLELMYATGMRVSEVVGLRLGQLDLQGGWVRVMGKGSKERVVPFGERAAAALRRYLEVRAARFGSAGDVVFLNGQGRGPITRGGFGRRLGMTARRAGFPGRVTPHQIRHSCATLLLEGGADIRVLQELLGHSSITTTQRYAHVTTEHLRAVCQRAHPRF